MKIPIYKPPKLDKQRFRASIEEYQRDRQSVGDLTGRVCRCGAYIEAHLDVFGITSPCLNCSYTQGDAYINSGINEHRALSDIFDNKIKESTNLKHDIMPPYDLWLTTDLSNREISNFYNHGGYNA